MAEILHVAMRWLHIASVTTLVGGMLYGRLVAPPELGAAAQRFRPYAWAAVLALIFSGLYNIFSAPGHSGRYHMVLGIKLRKSPFDFSTSHHAHQELIKGVTTDFSGSQLALIEVAHWYELVLLLGLVALFFAQPIWVGVLIALGAFVLEVVIDNVSARVTWVWMLKVAWIAGLGMALADIVWRYI